MKRLGNLELDRTPARRREWLVVWLLAGLWCLLVGWFAWRRHLAFDTSFDLAVFAQVVWAAASGHGFHTSLIEETTNFLGYHFTPVLAVFCPLYSLWPDARVLLAGQTLALAAGALPLFQFSRRRLSFVLALALVVAYLLSPALHAIALFDFHAIALAVPLLMAAGAALLDERAVATVLWLGLALLVKEEVALIAVGFGLYGLLFHSHRRLGWILTVSGLLWTLLLFGWLMPALAATVEGYVFVNRYGTLGATPGQMVRTLVTQPRTVLHLIVTPHKLRFLGQMLAPLAGLPLLGLPAILLTLPTLGYLLLSDYTLQSSIRYHYTAPLLPFLFLSTVIALQRLDAFRPRLSLAGIGVLLAATLVCAWVWSPLPLSRHDRVDGFTVTSEDREAKALLSMVPDDVSVVSDWTYMPWVANRTYLDMPHLPPFRLLSPQSPPEVLLVKKPGPGAISAPLYPWIVPAQAGRDLRVPRYAQQAETSGGLTVWTWRGASDDVLLTPYDVPFERGVHLVAAGLPPEAPVWGPVVETHPGETLPVWMAWGAHEPLEQRMTFTIHLVDSSGERVAQMDQEMDRGRFPTTLWHQWLEQPVVADEFPLSIPLELDPGRYRLLAGVYESETVVPLSRPDGTAWFELATIEVRTRGP